jgi:hypothetical protein
MTSRISTTFECPSSYNIVHTLKALLLESPKPKLPFIEAVRTQKTSHDSTTVLSRPSLQRHEVRTCLFLFVREDQHLRVRHPLSAAAASLLLLFPKAPPPPLRRANNTHALLFFFGKKLRLGTLLEYCV